MAFTLKEALRRIEELEKRVNELESRKPVDRPRGPKSTRGMTEDDAKRIMVGDMKDKSIGNCAKELGLSYGQIYSARNGYTFKGVYAEKQALLKAGKK